MNQLDDLAASTIMIVDDEPTTIDVLEMLLQAEGCRSFVTTTDSERTLGLLREKQPDVLLLNLMMPNVGGLEILRSMRDDAALARIPVLVLTSSTDARAKLEALELGARDFLRKPVEPRELALRVRNALAARACRDRLDPGRRGTARAGEPVVSRMAGKDPRLTAIIERFVGRLETRLEAIEASFEARDFEELASLAHWLKGAAGTVGFDAFTAPAEELKLLAQEHKGEAIEASIRELRSLAERIVVTGEEP